MYKICYKIEAAGLKLNHSRHVFIMSKIEYLGRRLHPTEESSS